MAEFPPVPLTLEGSALLHQFFRFDWKAWRSTLAGDRGHIAADGTCGGGPEEGEAAGINQIAGEGHDDFAGKRDAGGFDTHQGSDARVSQ